MRREARVQRDLVMRFESLSGLTHKEIARRHGVSTKTVQRAVARARCPSFPSTDTHGVDQLSERWAQIERMIEDLALARMEATNPRTQVAAIRVQSTLLIEQVRMLIALRPAPGAYEEGEGRLSAETRQVQSRNCPPL